MHTRAPLRPTDPPKCPLGRYRLLSPTASVKVSPICLGTMNFGLAWKDHLESLDKDKVFRILDYFYDNGGNFIDTANNFQGGESEMLIGEWMRKRNIREQIVIATKYSTNLVSGRSSPIMVNYTGNGSKSLRASVDASLNKLDTDYIDILYVHWWDFSCTIQELMQSLNQLVMAGKVLYLGISDTPAWVVSKANQYARDHNLRQFSIYQGRWSAAMRDFERDIIPMCRDEGMAIAPWGVLGGSSDSTSSAAFKTDAERAADLTRGHRSHPPSEDDIRLSTTLERIARHKSASHQHHIPLVAVAVAYVMHKTHYVFPVMGCRTTDHLRDDIMALTLELTESEILEIEAVVPFNPGFPSNFFYGRAPLPPSHHPADIWLTANGGTVDQVPLPMPIRPGGGRNE